MTGRTTNTQRGSIMITTAVSLFVLMGMLGLSIDLGRVYIAKHEAQAFADLASIAAARHLNGTQAGIDAANTEVTTTAVNANLWNFATTKFGSNATTSPTPTVEFATDRTGPWSTAPSAPLTNYAYVRVTATPSVNLAFLPAVGTALTQQVTGRAVGGVVVEPSPGYLPYTPFAHNAAKDANGNLLDPNYGFTVGQEYAIRWPGNLNKNNACAGDQTSWPTYDFSSNSNLPGSDRGYFQLQSAATIAAAILGGAQLTDPAVGDWITLTNGNKQSEASAMTTRAGQDTDQTNYQPNSSGTAPAYHGNDMRLVVLPVNNPAVANGEVQVIGFGAFLLYPSYAGGGGNSPWCAIYMGSRTQGGDTGGSLCSETGGKSTCVGSFVVRLVQ